jgi:hypothetical protein
MIDKKDNIVIQASLVNIPSGKAEKIWQVKGKLDDVLELEKQLANRLINQFGVSLTAKEFADLRFQWTQSLDAAAHFYTALDHYENGKMALALAEAKFAARIDPHYLPARF